VSFYDVIDKKVVDYCEIVCCLFEHCNFNCVFCPQNHSSVEFANEKDIMAKVPTIANYINSNKRSSYFSIHIMGGELFQDRWIDEGFLDIYEKFIQAIQSELSTDKQVVYNFVTNLGFTRRTEVIYFLEKNNLKFSISYDPHGRFNPAQKKIFEENLKYFRHLIRMVSCVMTKNSMQSIINGDEIFDNLYDLYPVDFDHLLPSTGTKADRTLMPKESEVLEFYKVLVDRYPECINIQPFTNGRPQNKMSCTRGNSLTVMPDGSIPKGCSGSVLLQDYNTPDLGGTKIIENWVDKYNCFQCEYFQRCPMSCFIKADFKHIEEDLDDCVFRQTFKYRDAKQT